MSKKYKYALISLVVVLFMIIFLYISYGENFMVKSAPVQAEKLPLKNEAKYTESFNKAINQSEKDRKKYQEHLKTQEGKKASDTYWNKMTAIAKSMLRDIELYGRIEDQDGHPVVGAQIEFYAAGGYLTKGTGYNRVKTDADGIFHIIDAKGKGLSIEKITKPGYEIKIFQRNFDNYDRFDDSVLWKEYSSRENPYVFKAWKVETSGYPKISHSDSVYLFKPGVIYSMDFTNSNKRRVKKEGSLSLDLQVLFTRDDSKWSLSLIVPDGGLLETTDLYMNLAPEIGYIPTVNFEGSANNPEIVKKYYIYSRGKLYGRLNLEIIPYYRDKSAIVTTYVMNLDGGRHLEVK